MIDQNPKMVVHQNIQDILKNGAVSNLFDFPNLRDESTRLVGLKNISICFFMISL